MAEIANFPIIISGPTGSGKTELSLQLAKKLDGEIINIDSVQLYKECEIGSAVLPKNERRGINHHLFGIYPPGEQRSAYEYLEKAHSTLNKLNANGKRAIFVGGSTLYIKLLLSGLDSGGRPTAERRLELESMAISELRDYAAMSVTQAELEKLRNDRVRLVRCIERSENPGDSEAPCFVGFDKALVIVLCWKRDALYERINLRTESMLKAGLVAETKELVQKYGIEAAPLQSIGYADVVRMLKSEIDQENLFEEISRHTRNYAKRQLNFWRNEPVKVGWKTDPAIEQVKLKTKSSKNHQNQIDILGKQANLQSLTVEIAEAETDSVTVWYVDALSASQ